MPTRGKELFLALTIITLASAGCPPRDATSTPIATTGPAASSGSGGSGGSGSELCNAKWGYAFGTAQDLPAPAPIPGAIAIDKDQNVVFAGTFRGAVDFGTDKFTSDGTDLDAFVAKLAPDGKVRWARHLGGSNVLINAIATDSHGNIAVAGQFTTKLVLYGSNEMLPGTAVAKAFYAIYTPSGDVYGARDFGDGLVAASGTSIQFTGDDAFLFGGTFGGDIDLGAGSFMTEGGSDVFVARFTLDGMSAWQMSNTLSSKGDETWLHIAADPSTADAVVYSDCSACKGALVTRVHPKGDVDWQYPVTGTLTARNGVAVDKNGNVVLAGTYAGKSSPSFRGPPLLPSNGAEIYVAKLDVHGSHVWSKGYGGNDDQFVTGVAVDDAGNVLLTGTFMGALAFGDESTAMEAGSTPTAYVAVLDPSDRGLVACSFRRADGPDSEDSESIAFDHAGAVAVTGTIKGTLKLGSFELAAIKSGIPSPFVLKLSY